jgi:hypothetical protein
VATDIYVDEMTRNESQRFLIDDDTYNTTSNFLNESGRRYGPVLFSGGTDDLPGLVTWFQQTIIGELFT